MRPDALERQAGNRRLVARSDGSPMPHLFGELPCQAVLMASWIQNGVRSLNLEQQAVAEGLDAILERLDLPNLDVAASSVVGDANRVHVSLVHRNRPELNIAVEASGNGEIFIFYGPEEEFFRSKDAELGRVWPFPSADHVGAALVLVEYLLTGRIELQVWKRPFAIKTRSYWINEHGQPELLSRASTLGPFLGWSRQPEIYRFDFAELPDIG